MMKTERILKTRLLEEQRLLKGQLAQLPAQGRESLGYGNHMADDATEAFEQTVGVAIQRDTEGRLEAVEHALAKLDAAEVDLAVVDVNLAGEPSFPVADALRARGVPFLFTTGYGQQGLPERFADAAVLAKPFRRQDIQDALAGLRPAA